jgi:fatty-acyl-CoA synthase
MPASVMNLGRLLTHAALRYPGRPGLVWRGQSWTWSETNARVDALARALAARGLGRGDAVLVLARNSNQMFETLWACFKLGAIWVPCNFRLTAPEVAYLAASSRARAMISDADFAAQRAAVAETGIARHILIGESPEPESELFEDLIAEGGPGPFDEAAVAHDDPCWYFYTSGTTGRPKGAILTHGQLAFVTNNHIADLMPGLAPDHASLVVAPLSHGAGAHALAQVAKGAVSVITDGPGLDEAHCWQLVEEHRISNMFTVPTILTRLVRHPSVDQHDHSSLRHVIYAGAPLYREDQRFALEKLGKVIVQYYGLGEVTGNITVLPAEEHFLEDAEMRIGSCGFPRTGMELAIKDPEGRRLQAGEAGEICVRGPAVFAGYLENPEANAEALKEGWFHSGDLGRLDEAGYLWITGRASDMYISGGANVYPREAEELLLTHPAVAEVAVLGVPDRRWGESGVAVVVPAGALPEDTAALVAEILGHLDGKLASYKRPRRLFFWSELPTSGYGKVPKHLIRQKLMENGDLEEVGR